MRLLHTPRMSMQSLRQWTLSEIHFGTFGMLTRHLHLQLWKTCQPDKTGKL